MEPKPAKSPRTTYLKSLCSLARSPGGLLDLGDDEDVAEHDGEVGDDLEEDELAPKDVEAAVERVVPHLGGDDGALLDAQLEEFGHVVSEGDGHGDGHLAGRQKNTYTTCGAQDLSSG